MRIVNLAQCSFYAVGAYVSAWAVGSVFGAAATGSWQLAGQLLLLPIGAIAVAALGALIEPTLLRPLYNRPEEYILLITFGMLMVFEDGLKLAFGGTPLSAGTIMDGMGSLHIGSMLYPAYNLVVIGVGVAAVIGLWWFIYRTRFGVILRATSQDRRMAAALGLNVGMVYVQAFAIGCFMAGLGGAVVVPAQAAVLGMGIDALVLAFVVVVIGGLGSLEGALIGALIVAGVRTAGIQFFAEIELAVLYLIAAAVLIVRPTGLFGKG
jgi:branched-subunit amino acid ABC-type transport system permease component